MKENDAKRVAIWTADRGIRNDLSQFLKNAGLRVLATDSHKQVRSWMSEGQVHLVIADLSRTFLEPLDFLSWVSNQPAAPPVVIVSEQFHVSRYLEAMRRGAFDAIVLPLREAEVRRVITRALQTAPELSIAGGAG